MNVARVNGAALPPVVKTPEEVIDEHADAIAEIAKRLLASNDALRRENFKVQLQLKDALDAVEEMRGQLRTKDEIIGELQALVAGKVAR